MRQAGEVGRHLKADMHLEADEICEEFVDLRDPIMPIEGQYREGSGREGGIGSLSLNDNVEGGGHVVVVVVVVAGKVCHLCRTRFWVVWR